MTDKKECGVYIIDRLHKKQNGGVGFMISVHTIESVGRVVAVGSTSLFRYCQMRIDANKKVDSNAIEGGTCFFTHDAAKNLIAQFKRGTNLIVRLAPYAGVNEDVDLTLSGFSAAFNQMNKNLMAPTAK